MKNSYKKIILTIILILHAFTNDAREWPSKIKNGTFGLCNCNTSNIEPNIFELTLNSDSTFNYIDHSDSKNSLHLTGTWVVKGKKLSLISNKKKTRFHNKWKFDSKTQCIKSRLKLNFVRVCLLKSLEVD